MKHLITWFLVLFNIVVYIQFSDQQKPFTNKVSEAFEDSVFIKTQGLLFAQIIDKNPLESSPLQTTLAVKSLKGNTKSQEALGRLAFRNVLFQKYAQDFNFTGDQVAYSHWKTHFQQIQTLKKQDPTFWMGVSSENQSWKTWVSYQFLHGGLLHLISNLWFLLIFGKFLERKLGSFHFIVFYIFAGVVAALFFKSASGLSLAPLIGASGSISGMMGFVLTLYWRKSIKAFYWILPVSNYHGIKKVPVQIIMLMWIVSDLAGYLSTHEDFGGVAHAAHVGGFFFGICTAFVYTYFKSLKNQKSLAKNLS